MEFSRAVFAVCAFVLGLMFYVVAGLLLVLTIVDAARGEPAGAPASATIAAAVLFALLGWASRRLGRRIA